MTNVEMHTTTESDSIAFIKQNRKLLNDTFANLSEYPSVDNPVTILMAGSPGAGKTEFSKVLQDKFYLYYDKDPSAKIVRVDADDIREVIPFYTGSNSHEVQRAASMGMDKVIEHVLQKRQNVIIDGTFAHYNTSKKNIDRSIKRNRPTEIYYIYQDPRIAWNFTQIREKIEKRKIRKEDFIFAFFSSIENVNMAKQEYGAEIKINLIEKDQYNEPKKTHFNIDSIENYLKITYNRDQLQTILL